MSAPDREVGQSPVELHLQYDLDENRRLPVVALAISIALHLILFGGAALDGGSGLFSHSQRAIVPDRVVRRVTPLVAPRLTQREPNKGEIAKELDLAELLAKRNPAPTRTAEPAPPKPSRRFVPPPAPAAPQTAQATMPNLPPPPGLSTSVSALPTGPTAEIKLDAPPKLAFEAVPGLARTIPKGEALTRLTPPKNGLQEMLQSTPRLSGAGLSVGDDEPVPSGIGSPSSDSKPRSNVELLSDPKGVDFKPYLIRVLASVRRNWFAVIPESARFGGRRGRVNLQFAIGRDGRVIKLVIANGSGTDALDRAAIASISASSPFPPLPDEFTGADVRLQLSFFYNSK